MCRVYTPSATVWLCVCVCVCVAVKTLKGKAIYTHKSIQEITIIISVMDISQDFWYTCMDGKLT